MYDNGLGVIVVRIVTGSDSGVVVANQIGCTFSSVVGAVFVDVGVGGGESSGNGGIEVR